MRDRAGLTTSKMIVNVGSQTRYQNFELQVIITHITTSTLIHCYPQCPPHLRRSRPL